MRLTLPYPPSANRYWRVWRGRAVKSDEARDYQKHVRWRHLLAGTAGKALGCPVVVSFAFYRPARRGDLDNRLKVILDALKGIAFNDDKQVVELHAIQFEDPANPRVEVTVEAA